MRPFLQLCVVLLVGKAPVMAQTETNAAWQVYAINKTVNSLATNEDLSTPETAYVTWNRACAGEGQGAWRRLSVSRVAERIPPSASKPVPEKQAQELLNSEILEVRIYSNRLAAVIAKVPHPSKTLIDLRVFERENQRWLNSGQDIYDNVASARTKFSAICTRREAEWKLSSRPAVADPEEHLRKFTEFLKREAKNPQSFLLNALETHRVVILGEVHNRSRYWAFNTALVRSPEFARRVGVIYLEFPQNDQPLMDHFLASPKYDPEPVIEMLRQMFELGWPDQPTLEFCRAVWDINQALPLEQRIRIVLVDMSRPWKEITKRDDWRKYEVNRDELMAANIVHDLRDHADARHALFMVGYAHVMMNLEVGGEAVKSAGWHLGQKLGRTNVWAVFPHSPVMSNRGEVTGRIALGLFESAFAAMTNRPLAFPLDHGPFGEQIFDASLDTRTTNLFRQGYDAYLYLGPLEDEVFSPLIPGFYTDDYALEVDRRCKLMFGKSAVEVYSLGQLNGENIAKMRSAWWGQRRREWSAQRLGPMNAWRLGSDWEKKAKEAKHQDWGEIQAIRHTAQRLFAAIQKADYDNPGDWQQFPAPDVEYQVYTDYPAWMHWICTHFRTNPIIRVDLGEVVRHTNGWPCVNYTLTLKDATVLQGTLPFQWAARGQQWYGVEGLDWHRKDAASSRKSN